MFGPFNKRNKRLNIQGNDIFIDNSKNNIGEAIEIEPIFRLTQPTPEIKVYEDEELINIYKIETLYTNPNLTG